MSDPIEPLNADWSNRVDAYLAKVHETTTFDVNLKVTLDSEEMQTLGSPVDWDWRELARLGGFNSPRTKVDVRSVTIEHTSYVDDSGRVIMETSYSVHDTPVVPTENKVLISEDVVNNTLTAFSEGVAWSEEQRSAYEELAESVGVKAPVEGDENYD